MNKLLGLRNKEKKKHRKKERKRERNQGSLMEE
jgi:hypothetical protein